MIGAYVLQSAFPKPWHFSNSFLTCSGEYVAWFYPRAGRYLEIDKRGQTVDLSGIVFPLGVERVTGLARTAGGGVFISSADNVLKQGWIWALDKGSRQFSILVRGAFTLYGSDGDYLAAQAPALGNTVALLSVSR